MTQLSRYRAVKKVSFVNASINSLLAIFKIIIGVIGNSHALVADGIHSFSDLLSDALVLLAAKMGSQNPDEEHPYGHHRIETIGAVIISVILLVVAGSIVYETMVHLIEPSTLAIPTYPVLIVAFVSVAANEWLYRYTLKVGNKINSNLLITNAWHNRGDALVSIIVLVTAAGAMLGIKHLDAIGAIIIALLIAKMGIKMIWSSISELIDAGADQETVEKIKHAITSVPGVVSIHQLRTRLHAGNIFIDVHIIVDPCISVSEGHYISDQVYSKLSKKIEHVADITVHIDPEDDETNMPSLPLPNRPSILEAYILIIRCRCVRRICYGVVYGSS